MATVTQESFESQYYITRTPFGARTPFAMTVPVSHVYFAYQLALYGSGFTTGFSDLIFWKWSPCCFHTNLLSVAKCRKRFVQKNMYNVFVLYCTSLYLQYFYNNPRVKFYRYPTAEWSSRVTSFALNV